MTSDSESAPGKILVIDDDEPFRLLVTRMLNQQGYQVAAAADGREGLKLAASLQPDLVLCDLNMPDVDGYQVLEAIRQDVRLADTPVIFLTGLDAPEQVRRGMNLGADDYLAKPVGAMDLCAAVRARLRRRAHRARAPQAPAGRPLRGLLVDDDPLFRGLVGELLRDSQQVSIVGEAGSLAEARRLAREQNPQVVLLDVSLPDGSGFELLHDLKPEAAVVFISGREEAAVHAFDVEAVDYVLKPASAERLQQALRRVQQRFAPGPAAAPGKSRLDDSFLVKTLTEKRLVKVRDVRHIKAYGEYSWVYWDNGRGAMLRKSLKHWLAELPAEQFVRVHRRAIVNLAYLEKVEKLPTGRVQVRLRDMDEPVLVSLRLAPALNRKLKALPGAERGMGQP